MLGVWVRGWGSRPPESLAVRTHAGSESLSTPPAGVATNVVANLPSGWLVNTSRDDKYKIARVDHDATVHRLIVSGANVTPLTGDVAVVFENRVLLYRPADDTLHVAPQPGMRWRTSAYVTSHGALLVFGRSGEAALWARFDKGRWSQGRWAAGTSVGAADTSGDHIAVALGGPTADGVDATPVAGLTISDDGGRSWRDVRVPSHLDEALSAAVTADGTAFISTGTGPLLRVRPGRAATVVRSLRPIVVSAVGNRLYALEVRGRRLSGERVLVSRDRGRSWLPGTLPGRAAS